MARPPRLTVAGYPHHVIQQGNNRQSIFPLSFQTRVQGLLGDSEKGTFYFGDWR